MDLNNPNLKENEREIAQALIGEGYSPNRLNVEGDSMFIDLSDERIHVSSINRMLPVNVYVGHVSKENNDLCIQIYDQRREGVHYA